MTSPSGERYLSKTLLNKSLQERLCEVDAMVDAITDYAITQLDATGNVVRWCPGAQALLGTPRLRSSTGRCRCSTPKRTLLRDLPNAN